MPSYYFNLLWFVAVSLSFLAKGSGCLWNTKLRAMSQCLFGFLLLVYSWLQPFSCIWYSIELYRHLFICVFFGWCFPLLLCAALSWWTCKYSPLGCLLISVIFFLCFPCLYIFFIMAFKVFSVVCLFGTWACFPCLCHQHMQQPFACPILVLSSSGRLPINLGQDYQSYCCLGHSPLNTVAFLCDYGSSPNCFTFYEPLLAQVNTFSCVAIWSASCSLSLLLLPLKR